MTPEQKENLQTGKAMQAIGAIVAILGGIWLVNYESILPLLLAGVGILIAMIGGVMVWWYRDW